MQPRQYVGLPHWIHFQKNNLISFSTEIKDGYPLYWIEFFKLSYSKTNGFQFSIKIYNRFLYEKKEEAVALKDQFITTLNLRFPGKEIFRMSFLERSISFEPTHDISIIQAILYEIDELIPFTASDKYYLTQFIANSPNSTESLLNFPSVLGLWKEKENTIHEKTTTTNVYKPGV